MPYTHTRTRVANVAKWLLMPCVALSGYMLLPFGCCIHNPLPHVVLYDGNDDNRNRVIILDNGYIERTVGAGMLGIIGSLCGCVTCCGFCGAKSPRDIL